MNQKQFQSKWWIQVAIALLLGAVVFAACASGGNTDPASGDQESTPYDVNPTTEAVDADFTGICGEKADLDPAENSVVPGVLCTFSNKTGVNFSVAEVVSNVPGVGVLGSITPTQMELPIYGANMNQIEDSFLRLEGDTTKVCVDFSITGVSVAYTCPFLDVSP